MHWFGQPDDPGGGIAISFFCNAPKMQELTGLVRKLRLAPRLVGLANPEEVAEVRRQWGSRTGPWSVEELLSKYPLEQ